jgi:hypothetical protein
MTTATEACRRILISSLLAMVVVMAAARAHACGASGGAVGASACSLSEHEEEVRKKWRVGANYAYTSTAIRFDGSTTLDETRHTVLATLAYQPTPRWTLELGLGALIAGSLDGAASYSMRPGLVTTVGASYQLVETEGARPFVLLTGQIAYANTTTQEDGAASARHGYNALDARLGVIAGWTLLRAVSPYAVARAFGGPVFWTYQGESVTGTDTHHYQVGAGILARAARRLDVYVEGIPLGEQAVSAGVGLAF